MRPGDDEYARPRGLGLCEGALLIVSGGANVLAKGQDTKAAVAMQQRAVGRLRKQKVVADGRKPRKCVSASSNARAGARGSVSETAPLRMERVRRECVNEDGQEGSGVFVRGRPGNVDGGELARGEGKIGRFADGCGGACT